MQSTDAPTFLCCLKNSEYIAEANDLHRRKKGLPDLGEKNVRSKIGIILALLRIHNGQRRNISSGRFQPTEFYTGQTLIAKPTIPQFWTENKLNDGIVVSRISFCQI